MEPMQEAAETLLLVLVTRFPSVDPLGGSLFFLALTREYSGRAKSIVLAYLLAVVRVGGGLLVILSRREARMRKWQSHVEDCTASFVIFGPKPATMGLNNGA
jgi:small neutral amino acid transporter SnatA (MarC family)